VFRSTTERIVKRVLSAIVGVVLVAVAWAYAAAINYPAVVVQAWILWFDFSGTNGLLLAGATALSILARYIGAGGNLGRGNLLARRYIEERGDLTIVPLDSLENVVPPGVFAFLQQPFSWWRNPAQWIVCLPCDASRRSIGQVVTYRSLLRACITFLPDTPERLTVFQRFCLKRAAIHCARGSLVVDREGQIQAWQWSVPWLAVLADWSPTAAMPLVLMVGIYWRLHVESDWLRQTTGDIWIRDESLVDAWAASELTDIELAELDDCLAEYELEDAATTRATTAGDMVSALQDVLLARYSASLEFSGGVRTLALRDQIKRQLDPPGARQEDLSASKRLAWEHLVPFVTPVVSVAMGACVAVLGQRHTAMRLSVAGVLVAAVTVSAALSWRYVFRARRRLLDAVRRASAGNCESMR
jgi:hypothetical protein